LWTHNFFTNSKSLGPQNLYKLADMIAVAQHVSAWECARTCVWAQGGAANNNLPEQDHTFDIAIRTKTLLDGKRYTIKSAIASFRRVGELNACLSETWVNSSAWVKQVETENNWRTFDDYMYEFNTDAISWKTMLEGKDATIRRLIAAVKTVVRENALLTRQARKEEEEQAGMEAEEQAQRQVEDLVRKEEEEQAKKDLDDKKAADSNLEDAMDLGAEDGEEDTQQINAADPMCCEVIQPNIAQPFSHLCFQPKCCEPDVATEPKKKAASPKICETARPGNSNLRFTDNILENVTAKIINDTFEAAKARCLTAGTYAKLFHFCGDELCKLVPSINPLDLAAGMFCAATDTGLNAAIGKRLLLMLGMCPQKNVTMATGFGDQPQACASTVLCDWMRAGVKEHAKRQLLPRHV
jgi:hypothetical protein